MRFTTEGRGPDGSLQGGAAATSAVAVAVAVGAGGPATAEPPRLVGVGEPGYRTVGLTLDVPGPMLAAVENALDVPHTSFLHRGLFRGRAERVPVGVTVRHRGDAVEAVKEAAQNPRTPMPLKQLCLDGLKAAQLSRAQMTR